MDKRKSISAFMTKERIKGIIAIVLYFLVLPIAGLMIAVSLLKAFRAATGIFNEDIFNDALTWIPFLIMLIVFAAMYFKTLKEDFKRLTRKNAYFIIVLSIAGLILNQTSNMLLDFLGVEDASNVDALMGMFGVSIIMVFIITTICGPVIEELVFRKAYSQVVSNEVVFYIISILSFALVHSTSLRIIPFLIIGATYAVGYWKTDKNVASSILLHFINNLVFTCFLLIGW